MTVTPSTSTATVLVVEDDPGIAELERSRLEEAGYDVVLAATAEDAIREVSRGGIDLVLLDYRLPGEIDGLEFYTRVKSAGYDLPVILVTGFGNEATVIQALRIGVRDFVTKSLEYLDYLPEAVARILRQVGTERRLAESEARLAGIIESAKDAVVVVESDRCVSLFNPAAEHMFRCPASEALGRPLTDFIPNDLIAQNETDEGVESGSLTHQLRTGTHGLRAGGEVFPLEATVSLGQASGRRFYTVVVRDMTDQIQAEETLRRSEALLLRAESMAHIAGWIYEIEDGIYVSSEEGSRICECTPGPHTDEELAQSVHPDDREILENALRDARSGIPFEIEHRLVFDGRIKWVNVRAEPETDSDGRVVRLIGVTQDITARRQLEEQFRQSQKMEAFGQLAGGVAHDFNNLLTIINGYSDLILESLPLDDPNRILAAEIHKAGEWSARLTRQLLAFSRQQVLAPRVLDLNVVVADAAKMLHRVIGEDVRLSTVTADGLWPVKADPGQVEQILLNLAVNARDAMPTGGKLTIETRNVERPDFVPNRPDARSDPYVLLAVSDTGHGMTDEVKAKIFEPFFTTKAPGKGTGLGLATVYGIAKQSGGHVVADSAVGVGTTFKVYLPRAELAAGLSRSSSRLLSPPRGTETVLVVEDEDAVRTLSRHILQHAGYTVLEAANGDEALGVAASYPGAIHLLVTDVVMAGLDGRIAAERLTEQCPGLRVLFVSGYTDDAVVRHGVLHDQVSFLQKPFTPVSLAWKVREVLDATHG